MKQNLDMRITKTGVILTGEVYLVIRHHYMGADGDYYSNIAAYTDKEAAEVACDRAENNCDHKDEPYDWVRYYVETVRLSC